MKKRLLLFLILGILVFNVTGCKNEILPIEQNNNLNDKIKILKLENYRDNPVSTDYEDDSLLKVKNVSIDNVTLNEREFSSYNNEKELDVFTKYIKDNLNVEINNNWKVMIHYYNSLKTDGMVEFQYAVGDIMTNRNIVFGLENGKFKILYYKCLDGKIDEDNLINRVNIFKEKYTQEKRKLKDGETFHNEHTDYIYYINADKLIYSYAYFFEYDIGVINNDWGTIRLIDENGNAISLR